MNLNNNFYKKSWGKRITLALVLFNFIFCISQASDLDEGEKKLFQGSNTAAYPKSKLGLLPEELLITYLLAPCNDELIAVNRPLFTYITGYLPDQITCQGFGYPPALTAAQFLSRDRTIYFHRHKNKINQIPSFILYSRVTIAMNLPLSYGQYLEETKIRTLKFCRIVLRNVQENVTKLADLLAHTITVTALDLEDIPIDAAGAQVLALNITLTKLNLWENQVGDVGAQALALNTTLTKLNLCCNSVGNAGAQALARNTTLTNLDLGYNKVGDAGVQALALNTTLTELDLRTNEVGVTGAQALARNTTLIKLDLYNNQVGDVGAQALALNTTLTNLNLELNQVGDAGAQALARNTTLTYLNSLRRKVGDVNKKS